jgi:hydrogenase nickel incorporation protein HypB
MCTTCGCDADTGEHEHDAQGVHSHAHSHSQDHDHVHESGPTVLRLERALLDKNDRIAERNRGWLEARGVLAINVLSSPGAGKTTLLERSIRDLRERVTIAVIEGDQATSHDADRIRAAGARAVQINTGTGCHLDAGMVAKALPGIDPAAGSVVVIENVGNLVCPALFDLGEDAKIVVASVTEGDDKPLKYPHMFRAATVVLLNKVDLLPHVRFDVDRFVGAVRQVNAQAGVVPVSATEGQGLDRWYAWLEQRLRARGSRGTEGVAP